MILKIINGYFLIIIVSCINLSFVSKKQNNSSVDHELGNDTIKLMLYEKLPGFEYLGLKRELQPNKVIKNGKIIHVRDSLLSIYLEDCVNRINYFEGEFRYDLRIDINQNGTVSEVKIIDGTYESDIYNDSIIECVKKIKFSPAILNGKNTASFVFVNVFVDLYNSKSRIKEELYNFSRSSITNN